jgi:hypothetical protein
MVQTATLTWESVEVFELDSPKTIVGRAPLAVRDLPEYVHLASHRAAFPMRLGDTLFVVIASDIAMCRQHFCIHRAVTASGEAVYFLQDLKSRCGTYLNDTQIAKVEHLKVGDHIRCSFRFLFNLEPENSGHRD